MKKRKHFLTNKYTDCYLFSSTFERAITLTVRLKSSTDIEISKQKLTNDTVEAAKMATSESQKSNDCNFDYPMEIRELIRQKRRARRIWHRTRHPFEKIKWNRISKLLHKKIKEVKNETFKSYLCGLSSTADSDYSLWKATRQLK